MKLEQSFEVAAPLERVWNALIDVEHVAPCLPGAAVTSRNEDGSYNGEIRIKIGPTTANYAGKLEMQEINEAGRVATMYANGTDKRGQGGATATIISNLREQGGVTRVDVVTDYHITGRLERFGRGGMIEDVSKRLLREFSKRLQDSLVDAPAPGPDLEPATAEAPAAPMTPATQATRVTPTAPAAVDALPAPAADEAPSPAAEAPSPAAEGPSPAADAPEAPPSRAAQAPPPGPQPEFTPPKPAEPIEGVSLMAGVMWDRVRRNPLPFVAGFLLVLLLLRRARR